ncbi:selenium metabolism-associated LysR family transcriptional regulator [Alkaliphilus oremlandii]|uniref:Transcriptional regulator, LysR family n=1 Tax=Alkaliphilus oremlandii (strain OhILAs) TaxID=350688 RepID=A8MF74_ALKOO|nr:selenium metabolism-associated LysR family transcriptional regulator [Alkaliphilus oremlandii]ABW18743.1 transcriptional regulator, LysR family [Alkaliphilus oremlandii OhILAs]
MDFRQLESFVTIIKFKSFSKAADYLFLTQPTISSHIQNLEKELNTVLINRSSKKISLTKAGEILYDYAVNIINLREKARFKLGEFKGKIVGNIEIASSTTPEQYIIPELICEFIKIYPDVTFSILHYDSSQVVEGILNGDIDFGIVGAKIQHNQLKYVELVEDELVVVTPYDESASPIQREVSLRDLLDRPWILREEGSGTRNFLDESLKSVGLDARQLQVIAHVENTEAIKQCIRRGLGISVLSKRSIEDEINYRLLDYFKIKDLDVRRKFYLVYHSQRTPSPLEIEFQRFVCEYFL